MTCPHCGSTTSHARPLSAAEQGLAVRCLLAVACSGPPRPAVPVESSAGEPHGYKAVGKDPGHRGFRFEDGEEFDASTPEEDAGVEPPDAGTPLPDAGSPSPDAGMPRPTRGRRRWTRALRAAMRDLRRRRRRASAHGQRLLDLPGRPHAIADRHHTRCAPTRHRRARRGPTRRVQQGGRFDLHQRLRRERRLLPQLLRRPHRGQQPLRRQRAARGVQRARSDHPLFPQHPARGRRRSALARAAKARR